MKKAGGSVMIQGRRLSGAVLLRQRFFSGSGSGLQVVQYEARDSAFFETVAVKLFRIPFLPGNEDVYAFVVPAFISIYSK